MGVCVCEKEDERKMAQLLLIMKGRRLGPDKWTTDTEMGPSVCPSRHCMCPACQHTHTSNRLSRPSNVSCQMSPHTHTHPLTDQIKTSLVSLSIVCFINLVNPNVCVWDSFPSVPSWFVSNWTRTTLSHRICCLECCWQSGRRVFFSNLHGVPGTPIDTVHVVD